MEVFDRIEAMRAYVGGRSAGAGPIGLVPTMGALHAGHASLIDRAREECATLVVSIFVNPRQFGEGEDFDRYPRPVEDDLLFCELRGVDAVFAPSVEEMYPASFQSYVGVGREAEGLCGASRPGHFQSVATVVLKLFHITRPDRAYFGEKDLQQLAVISRMVQDLNVPVEVVPCATVRESDGLALSSRNGYLDAEERSAAGVLYRALRIARERVRDGERDPEVAKEAARIVLALEPSARLDYLEMVDPVSMRPVEKIGGPVRVAAAVWFGNTRLIDNLLCEPPKRPRKRRQRPSGG